LEQFDQQIAKVFQQHTDRPIFEAFPGAGPVLAPRLLASMGSERERFAQPENLQSFSGVAPVTKQSGGKCSIHRRYLCPKFLKQSFHEYAKESILHSRWAAAYYGQQRNKGCGHHTAVRDRFLGVFVETLLEKLRAKVASMDGTFAPALLGHR